MKPFLLCLLLCLLLSASNASAGLITLNATNSGSYRDSGSAIAENYVTGWSVNITSGEFRSFFVFDLSSVSGTITAATLRLSSSSSLFPGYISPDSSETFSLFNVSTPIANLINGTGGVAAFSDLGSGTSFGSLLINKPADPIPSVLYDTTLNAAGLAYLQSNVGQNQIAFGGAITSLTSALISEVVFNATYAPVTRQLILTTDDEGPGGNPGGSSVPEPATLLLSGLALITLTAAKQRKR